MRRDGKGESESEREREREREMWAMQRRLNVFCVW